MPKASLPWTFATGEQMSIRALNDNIETAERLLSMAAARRHGYFLLTVPYGELLSTATDHMRRTYLRAPFAYEIVACEVANDDNAGSVVEMTVTLSGSFTGQWRDVTLTPIANKLAYAARSQAVRVPATTEVYLQVSAPPATQYSGITVTLACRYVLPHTVTPSGTRLKHLDSGKSTINTWFTATQASIAVLSNSSNKRKWIELIDLGPARSASKTSSYETPKPGVTATILSFDVRAVATGAGNITATHVTSAGATLAASTVVHTGGGTTESQTGVAPSASPAETPSSVQRTHFVTTATTTRAYMVLYFEEV